MGERVITFDDLTGAQRRTLRILSDGEWHQGGRSETDDGRVLGGPCAALERMGLVEKRGESRWAKPQAPGFAYRLTPTGLALAGVTATIRGGHRLCELTDPHGSHLLPTGPEDSPIRCPGFGGPPNTGDLALTSYLAGQQDDQEWALLDNLAADDLRELAKAAIGMLRQANQLVVVAERALDGMTARSERFAARDLFLAAADTYLEAFAHRLGMTDG